MNHCLLFLAFTIVFYAADSSAQPVGWEIVTADTAKIAVPSEWRNMDGIEVTRPIYRQGDGIGVPSTDEMGAPMQIGLTVEKFPISKDSTETIAKELVKGATNNPQLVVVGKESVESIKLSDQTATTLITTEFIKSGSRQVFI